MMDNDFLFGRSSRIVSNCKLRTNIWVTWTSLGLFCIQAGLQDYCSTWEVLKNNKCRDWFSLILRCLYFVKEDGKETLPDSIHKICPLNILTIKKQYTIIQLSGKLIYFVHLKKADRVNREDIWKSLSRRDITDIIKAPIQEQ